MTGKRDPYWQVGTMKNTFTIIALDENGAVVLDEMTTESWSISELQLHFDQVKMKLYTGKIHQLIIERV